MTHLQIPSFAKLFAVLASAVMLTLSPPASAQPIQEGIDYTLLQTQQPADAGGRIEVIEFFWYECSHCYALEPALETWIKKLPKDVEFRRVPAMWNDRVALSGRIFYTFEAMGEVERLHRPLFDAVHRDKLAVTNEAALLAWLGAQKVDLEKFKATFRSFAVESKWKRAAAINQAYKLDGVPALAVAGRYYVSASQTPSRERMLAVTSTLIDEARKQQGSAAKGAKGAK